MTVPQDYTGFVFCSCVQFQTKYDREHTHTHTHPSGNPLS